MKKCLYCAEEIQDAAIVCRFCGRDLATGQLPASKFSSSETPNHTLLDRRIEKYIKAGWQLVNRTPTTAQLKLPKQWNQYVLIFLVFLPFLGGFLFSTLWVVAIFGLIVEVMGYAFSKDQFESLTEEQEQLKKKQREHQNEAKKN